MSSYFDQAKTNDFIDLKDNEDFQRDLVRFFTGSRYKYSRDEIIEKGAEGLTEDFITHMRYQATNEVTALKDLQYVQDRENVSERELESFGSLMNAFDHSDKVGTGVVDGAKDFIGALVSSPSTVATVATGGWGIGSKLAARGATKATQLAVRSQIEDLVKKGLAKKAVKDSVQKSVVNQGLIGAGRSAAVEGAIGTGIAYSRGETREEVIDGYEYGATELAIDAALSATVGAVVGGGASAFGQSSKNKAAETLTNMSFKAKKAKDNARKAAEDAIESAVKSKGKKPTAALKRAQQLTLDLFKDIAAKEQTEIRVPIFQSKDPSSVLPLDPDLVKRGEVLRKELLQKGIDDRLVTTGLSLDTLKAITAASSKLIEKLKIAPDERISSAVSRYLAEGADNIKTVKDIRDDFGLSTEQFSLIYLAELSEAGKKLNQASQISKKITGEKSRIRQTTKAQKVISDVLANLTTISESRVGSFDDNFVQSVVQNAIERGGKVGTIHRMAKELDSARIAFMTSQVGTTAANAFTSGFNTFLDISDQFWKGFLTGEVVQRGWTKGLFANLRGMTVSKNEAIVLKELLINEQPLTYQNLFHDVVRAEVTVNSNSLLARSGRLVNTLNTGVDAIFKQSMLYAGVDRRLRQLNDKKVGTSFKEFIKKKTSLDDLPEGLLEDAIEDAQRFTFQQTYAGDKSAYGKTVKTIVKAHREAPFLISGAAGLPFPRYIANHLEYINDYTPIGIFTGGLSGLESKMYKGTTYKTWQDRTARQISGAAMLMGGVYIAAQKQGELDYGSISTISDGTIETGRVAGPFAAHLLLGDLIYRYYTGMPIKNMGEDALEVATGMGDLGFDFSLVKDVQDSIKTGEFTLSFEKRLGNIAATFTYPATIARDIKGQLDIEAAGSPVTRPLFPGDQFTKSDFGERNFLEDIIKSEYFAAQALRFLPDFDFIQYAESFNGSNDIKMYSGFNERATGSINPLTKQMGFREDPPLNKLQRQMNVLKIEEYELLNTRTVRNPSIYHAVSFRLSKTLPQQFEEWSKNTKLGRGLGSDLFANRTYDELGNEYKLKEIALREYVKQQIQKAEDDATKAFENLYREDPTAAYGFVRNQYAFTEQELIDKSGFKNIYDIATQQIKVEGGKKFKTAAEFLADSDGVVEELKRRQQIMAFAREMSEKSSKITGETRLK